MNIDSSNAHCGPRILFPDHVWPRVVSTVNTKTVRSSAVTLSLCVTVSPSAPRDREVVARPMFLPFHRRCVPRNRNQQRRPVVVARLERAADATWPVWVSASDLRVRETRKRHTSARPSSRRVCLQGRALVRVAGGTFSLRTRGEVSAKGARSAGVSRIVAACPPVAPPFFPKRASGDDRYTRRGTPDVTVGSTRRPSRRSRGPCRAR